MKTAMQRAGRPGRAARLPLRAAASPALPGGGRTLTRLEREAQLVVAVDVEYVHLRHTGPDGVRVQLPAEICLVNCDGAVILQTFCDPVVGNPDIQDLAQWRHTGGLPQLEWSGAPPLSMVRRQLAAAVAGRPLVGHNLSKDLSSLGLDHPQALRRDTMRYPTLQNPSGHGRSLAELAKIKLGRAIQRSARHDPWEDAVAALDLYLQYVHFAPSLMTYEDLVEQEMAALLGHVQQGE